MITSGKLSEFIELKNGLINANITTDRTSDYIPVVGKEYIRGHLQTSTIAQTKVATIQLLQAKAGGAESKPLTDVVTYTAPTGGGVADIFAEARLDQLDGENGYEEVAIKVTSDNDTAVIGSAIFEFGGLSYKPA